MTPPTSYIIDPESGRRRGPEQFATFAASTTGLFPIPGIRSIEHAVLVSRYEGRLPIASTTQLADGWLIPHVDGAQLRWTTDPAPTANDLPVAAMVELAMGRGAAFAQSTGVFELTHVESGATVRFSLDGRDRVFDRGDGLRLAVAVGRHLTDWEGRGVTLDEAIRDDSEVLTGFGAIVVPAERVRAGEPLTFDLRPVGHRESAHWVRIGLPQEWFRHDDFTPALEVARRPPVRPSAGGFQLLHGDLHNHSATGATGERRPEPCGTGSRESLFEFARDVAALDFFCLSEHDWQIDEQQWRELEEMTDAWYEPERFITIPGFEWTNPAYGHRNVYYRELGGGFMPSSPVRPDANLIDDQIPDPSDLWRFLAQRDVPAITVPHHMSAASFPLQVTAFHDPAMDRVAEIYSNWGDSLEHDPGFTHYAQRVPGLEFTKAIHDGYRIGFIASSDSHDGYPGLSQGTPHRRHLFHTRGSGLAGVWVDEPTREAVFDALVARRTYAVTGGRLSLWTETNGAAMGADGSIGLGDRATVRVDVGSSTIASATLYRNGVPIVSDDRRRHGTFELTDPDVAEQGVIDDVVSYFVRVDTTAGERAWSSPTWLTTEP